MKLQKEQFEKIRNKSKTIEVRLFDDKRAKLQIGDVITFVNQDDVNEKIKVKILNLHKFNSFKELYNSFPVSDFGYLNKEEILEIIEKIYSKEDEEELGVLGIEFELI